MLPDEIRLKVFDRDNYTCRYCGQITSNPHVDHIHPRVQSGSDDINNLVTACPHCNLSKGGRTPEQWRTDQQDAIRIQEMVAELRIGATAIMKCRGANGETFYRYISINYRNTRSAMVTDCVDGSRLNAWLVDLYPWDRFGRCNNMPYPWDLGAAVE